MEEFLIGSFKNSWAYYLLAFAVAELLLFLKERKGLVPEIIVASVICIALTVQGQYQSHSSWAAENRPVLLALVNFLSIVMPLFVFVAVNELLVKIRKAVQKHIALLVVVLATMFVWPLWALYVTCASGLDCL
ncbi:hypothetical protein [Sedimenticola selenatireducens]|uniref:hypothetical protein n=1 Tax=Sedimenticola selenatireducens TaxID=191960 RepID=UPI002AAB2513|nr:hypothetical protein [Sedimenticola selenatireducens]